MSIHQGGPAPATSEPLPELAQAGPPGGDPDTLPWRQLGQAVAHDLRAPVRHITAYGQLLQEALATAPDTPVRQYAQAMVDAGQQLGRMVDALADWARLGSQAPARSAVDTGALVAEVRHGLAAQAAGRRVEWCVEGPFPTLQADPVLLRLVWLQLLSNALKFSAPRPLARIELGCRRRAAGWDFHVRDNGVGFDPQRAAGLFGLFQRLHPGRQFDGLGAGLALCRQALACQGGRIWIDARPDDGCTASFSLPD